MNPGLVSVTFRSLSAGEIIALTKKAGLRCIEWGGDVHVPHGDLGAARETAREMKAAGLKTASYGSYYRAGTSGLPFCTVLETALLLETRKIRIWAGTRNAEETSPELWQRIADDIRNATELAAREGVQVVLEYHANTLTNTAESTLQLLTALEPAGTGLIWQQISRLTPEENLSHIELLRPWIRHIHCSYVAPPKYERAPLAEGRPVWSRYLKALQTVPNAEEILIEFVRDSSPELFLADAQELLQLLTPCEAPLTSTTREK